MKRFVIAFVVCASVLVAGMQMGVGQPNPPPGVAKPALPSSPESPGGKYTGPTWEYWVVSAKDFDLLRAAETGGDDPRNPDRTALYRKQAALDKLGGKGWELAGTEVEKGNTSAYIFKRKK